MESNTRQLIQILEGGKEPKERAEAAKRLGEINSPEAQSSLVAALQDSNVFVRLTAVQALDRFRWKPNNPETQLSYWIAKGEWKRCVQLGAPAVPSLLALISDPFYTGDYALTAIVQIGNLAVDPLLAILEDHNRQTSIRAFAAYALGQIGDKRAVQPLITALEDTGEIGKFASEALGKLKDNRAITPLVNYLKHVEFHSHTNILYPFGGAAVDDLIIFLKDANPIARRFAVQTLMSLRDERAVEPLLGCLYDDDPDVRQAVLSALGEIGDERAIEPLVYAFKDMGTRVITSLILMQANRPEDKKNNRGVVNLWEKCAEIGGPAVSVLIAVIQQGGGTVRKAAANSLIKLYRSGRLTDEHKRQILALRVRISQKHNDHSDHDDSEGERYPHKHTDESKHSDEGIGIPFPN